MGAGKKGRKQVPDNLGTSYQFPIIVEIRHKVVLAHFSSNKYCVFIKADAAIVYIHDLFQNSQSMPPGTSGKLSETSFPLENAPTWE